MSYMCRRRRRRVLMKDLCLYRRRRLYGVDTDVPADRQGHKTNTCSMLPVSSKIKIATLGNIHYWGDTPKSLHVYDIPSFSFSAYVPQEFCFLRPLAAALSAREKKNKRRGSAHASICSLIMYRGRSYSISRFIREPQQFFSSQRNLSYMENGSENR